jgi:hypothetical protein
MCTILPLLLKLSIVLLILLLKINYHYIWVLSICVWACCGLCFLLATPIYRVKFMMCLMAKAFSPPSTYNSRSC